MIESLYYTSDFFKITFGLFVLVLLLYVAGLIIKKPPLGSWGYFFYILAFTACSWLIVNRWIEAGRPPFKSFYESLVFAAWTTSLISLVAEYRFKIRILGLLASLSCVIIFIFALTKRDVEIIALPPALQTWMFIPHVISYFLAYGALFVAGLSALIYLFIPGGMASSHIYMGRSSRIDFLDFSYQISKFGFLFLTGGLLLGAWWGQVAWSNYWGWDPKENWAFITWLIFAAYLHFRNIENWSKRKLAWVVIIGVLAIIFTYLGMDYLPTAEDSLHIYSKGE